MVAGELCGVYSPDDASGTQIATVASDDEREVNGALLLVLADSAWDAPDADRILEAVLEFMESK